MNLTHSSLKFSASTMWKSSGTGVDWKKRFGLSSNLDFKDANVVHLIEAEFTAASQSLAVNLLTGIATPTPAPQPATGNFLETAIDGSNNDLIFTAPVGDEAAYTVEYRDPEANSSPLSLTVENDTEYVVNLSTSVAGFIVCTAADIAALFDETPLTVDNAPDNDGSGNVAAMEQLALDGSAPAVPGVTLLRGGLGLDLEGNAVPEMINLNCVALVVAGGHFSLDGDTVQSSDLLPGELLLKSAAAGLNVGSYDLTAYPDGATATLQLLIIGQAL